MLCMLMLVFRKSLSYKLDRFCNKNFVEVVKCWVIYDIYVTSQKIVSTHSNLVIFFWNLQLKSKIVQYKAYHKTYH